ncbi:core histone h2A/H2B/H3/H4 domain-containing protein [Ditylenchus destructor]|nr:core histone h2A/H2B/H3/H4 domain-containing protein [Ditylenchus destructor]
MSTKSKNSDKANMKAKTVVSDHAKSTSKTQRAGLQFPVGRIHTRLRKGNYAKRIGAGAAVYMAAVMEYLAAEVFELASNAARDNKKTRINARHIQLAVRNDEELSKFLQHKDPQDAAIDSHAKPPTNSVEIVERYNGILYGKQLPEIESQSSPDDLSNRISTPPAHHHQSSPGVTKGFIWDRKGQNKTYSDPDPNPIFVSHSPKRPIGPNLTASFIFSHIKKR